MHHRLRPRKHKFSYRVFAFCLDLDEIAAVSRKLRFFSHNRRNVYALRDEDHLRNGETSIADNVRSHLAGEGVTDVAKILLVTNLRTFGHLFNPVSFFFAYDKSGTLLCCLAEVANTFNEQKLYVVRQNAEEGMIRERQGKFFYISPFSDLDTRLIFRLKDPDGQLDLRIDQEDAEGMFFLSAMRGERRELSNTALVLNTLRFPFITVGIVWAIHWQAFRLWLKKVPFRKKSENPNLQRDTRRYLEKGTP